LCAGNAHQAGGRQVGQRRRRGGGHSVTSSIRSRFSGTSASQGHETEP
jgi:hypothetical protein